MKQIGNVAALPGIVHVSVNTQPQVVVLLLPSYSDAAVGPVAPSFDIIYAYIYKSIYIYIFVLFVTHPPWWSW